MVASHVGVQAKFLSSSAGGNPLVVSASQQVDVATRGIPEGAGYRRNSRGELGRREG